MDTTHSHYERNLPHRLPPGALVFITYRLAGAVPLTVRELWAEEERRGLVEPLLQQKRGRFARYDRWLDHDTEDLPTWLARPDVQAIVRESLLHFDGRAYALHNFCIMPNHVHILLTISETLDKPFFNVLKSQKGFSATAANRLLGRTGPFWQPESYDHVVKTPYEAARVRAYILNNPVRAGLVEEWQHWPGSYDR